MSLKNIVLVLGIGMVCIGTSLLFVNRQKSSELSDAEIKKRAEMLGMVEPNKDAILTSELENLKNSAGNAEDTENINKKETNGQQEDNLQNDDSKKTENNQEIEKQENENTKNADKNISKKDTESSKTSNNKTSNDEISGNKGLNHTLAGETSKKGKTKKANKSKKNKKNIKQEDTNKKDTKQQEIEDKNTTIVKISSGMTAGEICRKLQEEGLIEDAEDFRQYLVDKNIQRKLQAGTFEIINGADYEEILGSIYKG